MSTETIALLTILRDETQSKSIYDRCDVELANLIARACVEDNRYNKAVADEQFDCAMRSLFGEAIRHTRLRR